VLLGDTPRAHLLAARIYFLCGLESFICDAHRTPLDFIDPLSRHYSLIARSEIALEALDRFAEVGDLLPIIVPCNEYYRQFVLKHREFLDERFITVPDAASFFALRQISALV
jgi:hypothetical protein